jgi:RNA polymerase sigma-70 factor (ECF subfamily)
MAALLADNQRDLIEALARVAAGDRDAFGRLYVATSAKLFANIRRILGASSASEDAMQEAYVRIWRHAGDFDPSIASPIAWMTTIARHAAIDMVRSSGAKIAAKSATIDAEMADRLAAPETGGDPLAVTRLSDCLGKLDADRRGMVVMAYVYGLSREELAGRFERPVATVKTILRRSLVQLKECLGG